MQIFKKYFLTVSGLVCWNHDNKKDPLWKTVMVSSACFLINYHYYACFLRTTILMLIFLESTILMHACFTETSICMHSFKETQCLILVLFQLPFLCQTNFDHKTSTFYFWMAFETLENPIKHSWLLGVIDV